MKVLRFGGAILTLLLVGGGVRGAEREEGPAGKRDDPRARADWNAMLRLDRRGRLLSENRLNALRQACEVPVDRRMARDPAGSFSRSAAGPSRSPLAGFSGTTWQALGPMPTQSLAYGAIDFGDVSGRLTAIAVHPTNSSIVFVGGATGGIWKSTDGGTTFQPVADTAPSLSISRIVFSPSNTSVLYATTGEVGNADLEYKPSVSFGLYLGAGLLRSVDGGETWTRVDTNLPSNAVFSRVVVHPTDPSQVVVGVYAIGDVTLNRCDIGGIFRSTDGGVTFAETFSQSVSDLMPDPNVPGKLWAAFGTTLTSDPSRNCVPPPSSSGVWMSTDFGVTWSPSLVPTTPGAAFTSPTGNIRLGVGAASPTVLYASVLDQNNSYNNGGGIYQSTDGGQSWQERTVSPTMCPGDSSIFASQCEYNHVLAVSPFNPQTVYLGVVNLYKSTDGGGSWTQLFDVYGPGGSRVHMDQQSAAFAPGLPEILYLGNDGGLYRTTDGGQSFDDLNDSLTFSQFNGIALHPTDPTILMGGTQDTGNLRFLNSLLWTDRTGGDGGFNLIRQDQPNQVLAANYYAYMNYSTDGGDTFADATSSGILSDTMAFYAPAAAAPAAPGTVFFGTQRVWANPNFGASPTDWSALSNSPVTASVITALEILGDGSGPLWIGTRAGEAMFSTDGGMTFALRTTGLPESPGLVVTRIRAVSADGTNAYLTLGGFSGAPSQHVFRTTDAGQHWTNVSGNLPDAPMLALAIDPSDPGGLFVGTDVGVFHSTDGGASWTAFNQGLPNAPVTDLEFHPVSGDLIASTYGRGMFRILGPFSQGGVLLPQARFTFAPNLPAPGESVAFTDLSTGTPAAWSWTFGDGTFSMLQSPQKVYVQPGSYTVTLTVTNAAGSTTTSQSVVVVSGVASPVTLQIPVVLDTPGVPPTHYTSDLVVVNRSGLSSRLSLQYLAAPGTPGAGGPRVGLILPTGREFRVPDVIEYLRTEGYALPPSGPTIVGTLLLTFEDVSDPTLVYAGSRTTTPNPDTSVGGSFGVFLPGLPTGLTSSTVLIGLRQDSTARSNLAVVDAPGGTGPPTLFLQVIDGDTGLPAPGPPPVLLTAGEWQQFNSILGSVKNGYVRVTKTGGGTDSFIAYAVINDGPATGGGTGDGSYIGADAGDGLVPIILRVASGNAFYTSELILANPTSAPVNAALVYTPSAALGGGEAVSASVPIGANQQIRFPDAILWLRDTLGLPLQPGNANQGGTLSVAGALAYVRTSTPNPDAAVGGTFGLAYAAVPAGRRAQTEAWVYGLVQDGSTRSNLAIADARVGSGDSVTYVVDLFDSVLGDGITPAATLTVSLAGGQWVQFNQVLSTAGLSHGYARIRPQTGASDYVAYGVLNDGAGPGQGTSDGSYVAMSGVE